MSMTAAQYQKQLDDDAELEARKERYWLDVREELADTLAKGEGLKAGDSIVLEFGDVVDRIWSLYPERGQAAMELCGRSPELGGSHMKRLLVEMAQELVDGFSDAFTDDVE